MIDEKEGKRSEQRGLLLGVERSMERLFWGDWMTQNVKSIVQSSCRSAGRWKGGNRGVTAVTTNLKRGDLDLGDTVTLEHV